MSDETPMSKTICIWLTAITAITAVSCVSLVATGISLAQDISSLKNEISSLKEDTVNTDKALSESMHVETGYLWCDSDKDWKDGNIDLYSKSTPNSLVVPDFQVSRRIRHNFTRAYPKPPLVFLSDGYRRLVAQPSPKDPNDRYATAVWEVDTTGFVMVCASSYDPNQNREFREVGALVVNWISVPTAS